MQKSRIAGARMLLTKDLLLRFLCGPCALWIKDSSQGAIPSRRCISASADTYKEETLSRAALDTLTSFHRITERFSKALKTCSLT